MKNIKLDEYHMKKNSIVQLLGAGPGGHFFETFFRYYFNNMYVKLQKIHY